ncbi:MAG: AtpZ/AtpI family protein [Candidatus Fermentibacter sp.]|nr:AtpZ/AtpI family protein [Candidatus Fermentibacter sp.]
MLTGIPFMLGAATLLGWWLGSLADRHFGTGVILQAAGAAIGLAAAGVDTARLIKRISEEDS